MITPLASIEKSVNVGVDGLLQIVITQLVQDSLENESVVDVAGSIENGSGTRATHSASDITCSITGTQNYTPPDFSVDLKPSDAMIFAEHQFLIPHDSDGTKTVTFTVTYGVTGTTVFGDNKSVNVELELTRIPRRPSPPGDPAFTNLTPSSLTVSWAPSSNDEGSPITGYKLRRMSAGEAVVDNDAANLSRNVAHLVPGQSYTFEVYAKNDSVDNGGYSNPSDSEVSLMPGGVMVRYGDKWKVALPYVRYDGKWHLAMPYVRYDGTWHLTN